MTGKYDETTDDMRFQANTLAQRREAFFKAEAVNNSVTVSSPVLKSHVQQTSGFDKAHLNGDTQHMNLQKDRQRSPSPTPQTPRKPFGNSTVKELHGTVGFANIPNQVFRKAIKQGFDFTLMVVGQSGLGKSTFVNSLFLTDFYEGKAGQPRKVELSGKTLKIQEHTIRLIENGVSLTLTLVDTPGFGDAVDNSCCWEPIIQYVDEKFFEYFNEETKIHRKDRIPDNRVHCCLYFISPTGHGLKQLDIEFMKHLHDHVNIIPVIAKADTMTPDECAIFKKTIAKEISDNEIRIYKFPDCGDMENAKEVKSLMERVPFAVVGSNYAQDVGGKKVRCRKYPWGVVEVDSLEHNDFIALRNMLIRTHMIDLIYVTRFVHYENFRCRQLVAMGGDRLGPANKDPFTQMEDEKRQGELQLKQEDEKREQVFQEKLREKQDKLKATEKELESRIDKLRSSLDQKRREFEIKQQSFYEERLSFKQQYPEYQKYVSSASLSDVSVDERSGRKWKTSTLSSVFRSHKQVDD